MKSILKNIKDCIKQQCFAISYDWENKKVVSLPTEESYFDQIFSYRDIGLTIRCQCYANMTLKVNGKDYYMYMVGYGDMRREKFMHGENPIAKALDKCIFDYVYLFAQEREFAKDKMQFRVKQLKRINTPGALWNCQLLITSYRKHFGKNKEMDQIEKQIRKSQK